MKKIWTGLMACALLSVSCVPALAAHSEGALQARHGVVRQEQAQVVSAGAAQGEARKHAGQNGARQAESRVPGQAAGERVQARRAYERLAQRLYVKYRDMAVIGDVQYENTKAAIRNNRAHQTPLATSELLFARCMHDGNYAEASAIAAMAVFDAYKPAERAHFRLRQAETMIVRQIDLPGTQHLLEEAARELAEAGPHDGASQQDMADVQEYAAIVAKYCTYSPR